MKNLVTLAILAIVAVLCHGEQTYQRLESSYPDGFKWQLTSNLQRKQQSQWDYRNAYHGQYKYENAYPYENSYYRKEPNELAVQKSEQVGPQYLVPNVNPYTPEEPSYQYPVPSQRYQGQYY